MYLALFENRLPLLKTVYEILKDDMAERPVIQLYDGSRSKKPHCDNAFIPVDILRNSKTFTDFIGKFGRYSDRCAGFRAFVTLDMDDTIEAMLEYVSPLDSESRTMAFAVIEKVSTSEGNEAWKEDKSAPIPLFILKAITKNKGEVAEYHPNQPAYM